VRAAAVSRIACLCLLAVLLTGPTAAAQEATPAERAQEYVLQAADLVEAGRCAEALGQLESAVRIHPEGRRAWYFKALCHAELSEWGEAGVALDRFDGFELSERELQASADLRARLPGAGPEPADLPLEPAEPEPTSVSEPAPEPSAPPPASPPTARRAPTTRVVLGLSLVAGGAVALGVGLSQVDRGLGLAGNLDTWESGEAPFRLGVGFAIGGGLGIAAGAVTTISGAVAPRPHVAVWLDVDPAERRAGIGLAGRW